MEGIFDLSTSFCKPCVIKKAQSINYIVGGLSWCSHHKVNRHVSDQMCLALNIFIKVQSVCVNISFLLYTLYSYRYLYAYKSVVDHTDAKEL